MLAADIMTTNVVCVAPDTSVEAIANLLLDKHITGVPVTDAGDRVLGIVSDTDLMHQVAGWPSPHQSWWLMWLESRSEIASKVRKAVGACARDVMTSPAITIGPHMPVAEIAELLAEGHLRRVPVVSDGKLVGMVSRTNLIQALAAAKAGIRDPSARDREIRQQVLAHVHEQPQNDNHLVNVIVSDGVVHLWGVVETAEEMEASRLLAESIAGVRAVKNHIASLDAVANDVAAVV